MSFFQNALRANLNARSKSEQPLDRLRRIESLKDQLVKEGYQPSEAEHFLKIAAGTGKITELDNDQLDAVIERLEAQIKIAQKCKGLFK